MTFGRRALRGSILSYGCFLGSRILIYLSTLVLARVLVPHDFGLVGYALLIISYLDVIKDLGVNAALIYRQDIQDSDAGETFILSVASGLGFFGLTWLLAPLAAAFFDDPRVLLLTRVLGLTFVFSGLGGVHGALLQKKMRYTRGFLPDVLQSLVKGVVSVVLAFHGLGYWSLAWGQLAGVATLMVANWALLPWIPRLSFRWESARKLLGYGFHIILVNLLGTMINNGDYVIVGRLLGSSPLGLYTLAYTIPQMLTISLSVALSRAIFPAYAALRGERTALQLGYLTVVRYSALALVPVSVGLCVVTPAFVHALYRGAWWPAIPAMQDLALYAGIYAIGWNAGDIYKATGRPDIQWKLHIVHAAVLLPSLYAGAILGGIVGVALAQVVVVVPYSLIRFWLIRRILGVTAASIVAVLRVPVLAGIVLLGVGLIVGQLSQSLTPLSVLVLQTALGGTTYVTAVLVLDCDVRERLHRLALRLLGG